MVVAVEKMGLAEFWAATENREALYELEAGELRQIPPESDLNQRIAIRLLAYFVQQGLPPALLRMKTEIVVSGARATVRVPDLVVLSPEADAALAGATRSTLTLDMPPPRLVVEVVSPGKENKNRDYRYKRSQYQSRAIDEYWIIDPTTQQVTLLTLLDGLYEETTLAGTQAIPSPLLTELATELTAAQLLGAGN
ncbi:Uma2 family endonuclease [Leptolyngbya sp. PCC 6406]|uniref:Uma2 family endonuclease n=1 Tax=Leptolyngbya sp. PCC 6406 TaxID=1173264 RepID=UPI0002ACE4BF|nr:Uma2 family endonuclease [Leptolyngbya sp. PCC 6406]